MIPPPPVWKILTTESSKEKIAKYFPLLSNPMATGEFSIPVMLLALDAVLKS